MTNGHPQFSAPTVYKSISLKLHEFDLPGYVSVQLMCDMFNVLAWHRLSYDSSLAFKENQSELDMLFRSINLDYFLGLPLVDSTILLYIKLADVVDLRDLKKGKVIKAVKGANKKMAGEDFVAVPLHDEYVIRNYDIPDSFIELNTLFEQSTKKTVDNIQHMHELTRANSKLDLVKPDLAYKLATHTLKVNKTATSADELDKVLYVVQDSTKSMAAFVDKLHVIRSYIINLAIAKGHRLVWINYDVGEISRYVINSIDDVAQLEEFRFHLGTFNPKRVSTELEFAKSHVIFITDATDMSFSPINTVTRSINTISLNNNEKFKTHMKRYGKVFET